jgi:hypothetical protein
MSGACFLIGRGHVEGYRDFKSKRQLASAVNGLAQQCSMAVLELVHAMPGNGVKSMFSFGRASGVADAALSLALPEEKIVEVSPQKWQNFYRKLYSIPKKEPFDSRQIASKLDPLFLPFLKRKLDHNSADAILIACWWILENSDKHTLQKDFEQQYHTPEQPFPQLKNLRD